MEFDLRDDGEKIRPYHSAYLTESIIMCVYNARMQFTFSHIFPWESRGGHLILHMVGNFTTCFNEEFHSTTYI